MNNQHNFIENDLIILTKQTLDIFLKSGNFQELLTLYTFYYYTSKWQNTNQPKCTTSYAAKGIGWTEQKVRKIKKMLIEYGLIEDVKKLDDQKRILGHYIKMNYIFKKETLDGNMNNSVETHTVKMTTVWNEAQCGNSHGVEIEPPNALSDNNLNALSDNNLNALSDNNLNALSTNSLNAAKSKCNDYGNGCVMERNEAEEYKNKINYQLIVDMYNDTCVSFPKVKSLSNDRKKAIKARLNKYSIDEFRELFEKAQGSDFLKGSNERNWTANFDWLMKDKNFAKVLDGNYDKKRRSLASGTIKKLESNGTNTGDIERTDLGDYI